MPPLGLDPSPHIRNEIGLGARSVNRKCFRRRVSKPFDYELDKFKARNQSLNETYPTRLPSF